VPPRGGCVRQEQCVCLLAGSLHGSARDTARWRRGGDAAARLRWQYGGNGANYQALLHSLYQSACITLLRS